MHTIFKLLAVSSILCLGFVSNAQFAPQFPLEGNDAIHKSDARIKAWATGIEVNRGWVDIADTSLGRASAGAPENALGASNAMVVSLGDGGSAILTFEKSILNGDGPDFAIFENAFADPLDPSMAFLELAFVEVSTDGERYVRFPSICNLQTDSQITNFTYSDASLIYNLAGKYISGAGTPFDLEELQDSTGIDINNIRYIRIVDIVGSLDETFASYDSRGEIINGPYPSQYPSAGFDLESVAVLHQQSSSGVKVMEHLLPIVLYPNPATDFMQITIDADHANYDYRIFDMTGSLIKKGTIHKKDAIDISALPTAQYFLSIAQTTIPFIKK